MSQVLGHCPACGADSLSLGAGGHITCARTECPRPTAATEILADSETEHIVALTERVFTIRHPLRERLDDEQLLDCPLHEHLEAVAGPPQEPGRYRVTWNSPTEPWDGVAERTAWIWEPLP